MLRMDDAALLAKGVAALGARRKLLKVFEQIKAHCQANVSMSFLVDVLFAKLFFLRTLPTKKNYISLSTRVTCWLFSLTK